MIAQISPTAPRGSPSSSSSGVRWAGYFSRYSGSVVLPQTSTSSKSRPAARTKIRALRLFTLGVRMLRVFAAMCALLLLVGIPRRSVLRQRRPRSRDERLDGVREVQGRDVVVAALDAELVGLEQHLGVRVAVRWLEAVGGELDQQAERVLEVDRVHEAAVLDAAVADPALVEALDGLAERGLRQREGQMVHAARVRRRPRRIALALLVGEDRDEPAVTRVEVEVALRLVVEIGLLEHERHAEHALPEVDRRLPAGPDDRDVVDTLALELAQSDTSASARRALTCTRCAAASATARGPRASGRRGRCAASRGSPRRARDRGARRARAPRRPAAAAPA